MAEDRVRRAVPRIYFAGKATDWRRGIVHSDNPPRHQVLVIEGRPFRYAGPYIESCSHSNMKRSSTHAIGCTSAGEAGVHCEDSIWGCAERHDDPTGHALVFKRSMEQIDQATHVFAWIDSESAYGTLVEIGYALAKSKRLFVGFSSFELLEDQWFAAAAGAMAGVFPLADEAFSEFLRRCL